MKPDAEEIAQFNEIRSAFTVVHPATNEEWFDLFSEIFAADGFWGNQDNCHFVEYQYSDPKKPIKRFLQQKPVISRIAFTMPLEDMEDKPIFTSLSYIETAHIGYDESSRVGLSRKKARWLQRLLKLWLCAKPRPKKWLGICCDRPSLRLSLRSLMRI